MSMRSMAELDDICKLLWIEDSSGPSKRATAYKQIAKLCFLWAKIEVREAQASDESSLHSAQDWIVKAVLCFGKASQEFDQTDLDGLAELRESLTEIQEWINDNLDPWFLKSFCHSLDEGSPRIATLIAYTCLTFLMDRQVTAVMREYGERFEQNNYKTCLPWIKECLHASERWLNLGKLLQIPQDTINQIEMYLAVTQLYMNTMKACAELVEVISKHGRARESHKDCNSCLQAWINQCQQAFQELRDLPNPDLISDQPRLLDSVNAFSAQQDTVQLFRKTFNYIMGRECPSLTSSQLEKTLSFLPKRKKEESGRKWESDRENAIQKKWRIISLARLCRTPSPRP